MAMDIKFDLSQRWFPFIPHGWILSKIKYQVIKNEGGVWGDDFDDDGIIVLRSTEQNVDGTWNIVEPARRSITIKEFRATRLFVGDLLITKSSGSKLHIGKTSIVDDFIENLNCSYSNFMQRLRVNPATNHPKYFYYFFNSNIGREQYDYFSNSTTGLANLGADIIGNLIIAVPPFAQQIKLVSFLDHKTSQIDKLIAEKEKLLKLLEEKRIAFITQAVTKGLNPDVKMKPSGVDWLGDIPEHWEVRKANHLFETIGSGTTPKSDNMEYYNGDIPWVTTSELREREIFDTENKLTTIALSDYPTLKYYNSGSIVIAMYGATIGRLGILQTKATVNQACCVFDKGKLIDNKYFYYYLLILRPILISFSTGGGQPNLNQDLLKKIKVSCPPLKEQKQIVDYINRKTEKIFDLENSIIDAIRYLKEYRNSLITSAVTGKIDVRNYKPEEEHEEIH